MKIQNRQWSAVSGSSNLKALDIAVICASALFWSWLMLAVLQPSLYRNLSEQFSFPVFQAASLGVGTLVFACCAARPALATKLLDSRKCEIASVLLATAGGAMAFGGSVASMSPLALAGAIVVGATFPYFMLEWCRMYSRRGARTAAPLISGALSLSILFDAAIFAFDPAVRNFWVVPMPILIVAALALIQALVHHSSQDRPVLGAFIGGTAVGAADSLISDPDSRKPPKRARRRLMVLDTPVTLLVSGLLYGTVFGVMSQNGSFSESTAGLVAVFCIVATAICFIASCIAPFSLRPVVAVFQLAGIAGALMLSQSFVPSSTLHSLASAAFLAGFFSFVIEFWTLNSYFATGQKRQIVPLFSLSLALLCAGLFAGTTLQAYVSGGSLDEIWQALVVLVIILATLLLQASCSLPINVFFDAPAMSVADASAPKAYHDEIAQELALKHELTERETEILGLLIAGRSRPRIAEILCVSENTVNSHIQHVYRKLDVHSFQELLDSVYHSSDQ